MVSEGPDIVSGPPVRRLSALPAPAGADVRKSCGLVFHPTFRRVTVGEVTDTMIGLRGRVRAP
ncbi:hypothetical protein GCM10010252_10540 [Streptomyces aureoverticillatus]|nr:hypothetical protein GCM10010252_10540 [Streptomyces aureoverticillatus]